MEANKDKGCGKLHTLGGNEYKGSEGELKLLHPLFHAVFLHKLKLVSQGLSPYSCLVVGTARLAVLLRLGAQRIEKNLRIAHIMICWQAWKNNFFC